MATSEFVTEMTDGWPYDFDSVIFEGVKYSVGDKVTQLNTGNIVEIEAIWVPRLGCAPPRFHCRDSVGFATGGLKPWEIRK